MHLPASHNPDIGDEQRRFAGTASTADASVAEAKVSTSPSSLSILSAPTGPVASPEAGEPLPISGDAAALWRLLVCEGRLSISIVDAMGVYRYLSPRMLEFVGKKASDFLGRSLEDTMGPTAGGERLAFVRQAITAAKPLVLVESLAGVPLRTIIHRATAPTGEFLALCVHHIGAAATELPLDECRYTVITPVNHEITPLSKLTDREIEVLRMIAMGDSQAEIAAKIHRTVKTVEWHRASLGRKLGATSRVELARLAIRYGLVTTEYVTGQFKPAAKAAADHIE
jgi:DNA-binding CsgD family transcriptional regulator